MSKNQSPLMYKMRLDYQSGDIPPGEIEVRAEFVIHVAMTNRLNAKLNEAFRSGEIGPPLQHYQVIRWPQ